MANNNNTVFQVLDSPFNRTWNFPLINLLFKVAPSYCEVKLIKKTGRKKVYFNYSQWQEKNL
jgi:hypothetical protein